MRSKVTGAKRWVVKIGSALLTADGKGLDRGAMAVWVEQMVALREAGVELVLVSSGAVAAGMSQLGWTTRPSAMNELQAAAALGQMRLVQAWESSFGEHGKHTAQILLTHDDLSDRKRYLNARSTLRTLVDLGVVPVINENDTVVYEEIKFGDNDTLGALVANLTEADCLVILTDQNGLYTADPRKDPNARFVDEAQAGTPDLEQMAGGAGTSIGKGGMLTKILAAKRAAKSGAHTIIASGREENVLARLANGEAIGTQLRAQTGRMAARKQWMIDHLQLRGRVVLDAGAVEKLTAGGKSLLPIGVTEVQGEFARGEVISCVDAAGREVARGLTNYSSAEARLIARKASSEIEAVLGYVSAAELVHRDNLVLL